MNSDEMKTAQLLNDYKQHRELENGTRDLWNIQARASRTRESAVAFGVGAVQINQRGESL